MNFEIYAEKISSIRQTDIARNDKKLVKKRLQVKNTNMTMTSINKIKFASINDKRYYGSDGIVSLLLVIICYVKLENIKNPS